MTSGRGDSLKWSIFLAASVLPYLAYVEKKGGLSKKSGYGSGEE